MSRRNRIDNYDLSGLPDEVKTSIEQLREKCQECDIGVDATFYIREYGSVLLHVASSWRSGENLEIKTISREGFEITIYQHGETVQSKHPRYYLIFTDEEIVGYGHSQYPCHDHDPDDGFHSVKEAEDLIEEVLPNEIERRLRKHKSVLKGVATRMRRKGVDAAAIAPCTCRVCSNGDFNSL